MNVIVPLVDGFEEIEAITTIDVLRRAGLNVVTAGIPGTMVRGDNGVKIMTDRKLSEVDPEDFDAIVLPGGSGYTNLVRSGRIMDMIRSFEKQEKLIAAICFSPMLLAKAGVLDNRLATVYPGKERELPKPRDGRVVVDRKIITSQGPGTAMEFALQIVESLKGKEKADRLRRSLVCR